MMTVCLNFIKPGDLTFDLLTINGILRVTLALKPTYRI